MKTTVKVGFKDLKFGAKETTLPLVIKGDLSDAQKLALINIVGAGTGYAAISSAQADIDDYDDYGKYQVDENRTGEPIVIFDGGVEQVQATIDDAIEEVEAEQAEAGQDELLEPVE